MKTRELKGESIIEFLTDYTVVDIETTGLSPMWDDIIELGAIKYRNGQPVALYNSLVYSSNLNPLITALTGITNDMLSSAPPISDLIEEFRNFLGDDIIVGHNVGFDINFIYDACVKYTGQPLSNNFVNTVRFANKLLPNVPSKSLDNLCTCLKINSPYAHRAISDCRRTAELYKKLSDLVEDKDEFKSSFTKKGKPRYKWSFKDILSDPNYIVDENTEVFGKSFCFTGKLDEMPRKDAAQIVVNMGGSLTSTVTKKTDYLVIGSTDYCKSIKNGRTEKMKKADELQQKGFNINVISEDVFYQMISDK